MKKPVVIIGQALLCASFFAGGVGLAPFARWAGIPNGTAADISELRTQDLEGLTAGQIWGLYRNSDYGAFIEMAGEEPRGHLVYGRTVLLFQGTGCPGLGRESPLFKEIIHLPRRPKNVEDPLPEVEAYRRKGQTGSQQRDRGDR